MKTICLILSLLFGGFSAPTNPLSHPSSISVSYEIAPPVEKKKKKVRKQKKHKRKKYKQKLKQYRQQDEGPVSTKSIVFLVLSTVFLLILIGLAALLFSIGLGWSTIGAFFLIILGIIVMLALTIVFLILGLASLRKTVRKNRRNRTSTIKKDEASLRAEVPNLSERDTKQYLEINDELVAAQFEKNTFYKNIHQKKAAGMTTMDLKKELDSINFKISDLNKQIKDLKMKSRYAQ